MKKILKIITIILPAFYLLAFGNASAAATAINLNTDSQSISMGQQFSVSLTLDAGQNINAAQGTISFSPSVLKMISVDNTGSIFNFWVEDPTISNDTGTMSFIGGTPTSLSGSGLKILTMKFQAVGVGSSAIKFSNGVVTADDGQGTNVLSTVNETSVTVSGTTNTPTAPAPVIEQPKPVTAAPIASTKLPVAPVLSVGLYADQTKWYSQQGDAIVFWEVPKDVIAAAVLVDKNPNGDPLVFDKQLFDGKDVGTLSEGINYIHVRFKNNIGKGPISTYKVSIDITPPLNFKVSMPEGLKIDDPSPTIDFATNDSLSGIDFYSVIVDSQAPIKVQTGELKLPILEPGQHSVLVKAFDKAGNESESSLAFEILPIASPEIKFVTQPFYSDSENALLVQGSGLPGSMALISVVKSDGTVAARASAKTDDSGQWEYSFSQPFQNGKYQVVVRSQDDRGGFELACYIQ
jgi:hypothetical protein